MKLWLPIITIVLIISIGTGIYLKNNKKTLLPNAFPQESAVNQYKEQSENSAQINLDLASEKTAVKVGEIINYHIKINNNKYGVIGIESYFIYNPQILEILSIEAENFFENPNILINSIDPQLGKIAYTLVSLKYTSGNGNLFKINAKVKSLPSKLENILNFDKNNTKIGLKNMETDTLYTKNRAIIIYNEPPISILP